MNADGNNVEMDELHIIGFASVLTCNPLCKFAHI